MEFYGKPKVKVMLAGLLGNKIAVATLLRFLKTTEVRGREKDVKRGKLEWERNN